MQSGSPFENWGNVSRSASLGFAEKMFDLMKCEYSSGNYKAALNCMRGKDAKDFVMNMKHFQTLGHHPIVVFAPVKESSAKKPFITEADYTNSNSDSDIPVMMGVVANEGAFLASMIESAPKEIVQLEQHFDELIPSILYMFDRFDKDTMKDKLQAMREFYFNGEEFKWSKHKRAFTDVSSTNELT